MVGRAGIRSKGASNLLEAWPERTNRSLIAIVLVALLLGVPAMSMTALSVHLDRQDITVEPGSYRSFHIGFYGFGKLEYTSSSISLPNVYMLKLDRVNYYRFVAGEEYQYSSYGSIGGWSSQAGLIWDEYLVFVNDGAGPVQISLKLDGTAYVSMLPAVGILVAASAAGYWLGRVADKKAHLDMTDPLVVARRPVRKKAVTTISLLALLPIGFMLAIPAVVPEGAPILAGGEVSGFFLGLFITVIIAFQLRFKLTKVPSAPSEILANLAYRLRVSGYRVTEERRRIIVQVSSTSAVHITTRTSPNGTWVLFKPSATPSGMSIMIILLLTFIGAPLALALSLFILYRSSAFASMRIMPRLSGLPIPQAPGIKADTRMMIVESLSEGRRLSAEAYESARSNYQDLVVVMPVVGILLSVIAGTLAFTQIDSEDRGRIALAVGVSSAVVFSAISWSLLAARAKPRIAEFKSWSAKLDSALAREVAGQNPSDSDLSSFELIASSFREMPKWMKARRRAGGYRKPLFWLLVFFLSYGAFESGLTGFLLLIQGQQTTGFIAVTVCAALVLLAAFSYWVFKKRLDKEMDQTLSLWNERYEALKSDMERLLAGE